MKLLLIAGACFILAGCEAGGSWPGAESELDVEPAVAMHFSEANRMRDTVLSIASPGSSVIALCGASSGITYFANEAWSKDKIDGQFAIVQGPEGDTDLIVRSGPFGFSSVKQRDSANLALVATFNGSDFSVIVTYPSGVVETYLFSGSREDGVAIVTLSKPAVMTLPARASLFQSRCWIER